MVNWWNELVAGWWPGDQHLQPGPDVQRWLQSKHDVAARIQPAAIGEIGVRAGYCAFAMLAAAPEATYFGIDVDSPEFFTEPGSVDHAQALLDRFWMRVIIRRCDSHAIERLPQFDLLHIDGDHSIDGCTQDLELALRSGTRWVLVDDYDTGDLVRTAVDTFARKHEFGIEHIADGFRGSALLQLDQ